MSTAANAVLWSVEGDEFHIRRIVENVNVGNKIVVHARRISDETDSLTLKLLETVSLKHLYTCLDAVG